MNIYISDVGLDATDERATGDMDYEKMLDELFPNRNFHSLSDILFALLVEIKSLRDRVEKK